MASTSAQGAPDADADYQEVGYDQLVQEISRSQRKVIRGAELDPFDQVRIHTGFGMVNSFSTFRVAGENAARYQNGLQISMGVDLFSEQWFGETAFRNFGLTTAGSEEHLLKELDLKIGYRDSVQGPWLYRLQGGLAHRYLELKDATRALEIKETAPSLLLGAGLAVEMNRNMSLNFDIGGRSSVLGTSVDRSSVDFTMELKVSL